MRLTNAFVFPDAEPPTVNILYVWSGISGQLGLFSFISPFVIQSKLNTFVLFYYIFTFNFFFLLCYTFTHSVCICYYRIN